MTAESSKARRRSAPAVSAEQRENQMINLAVDLAEKQLREGTASSQVITHFLKLATVRESLERTKLERENELLAARSRDIEDQKKSKQDYGEVLDAFKNYRGSDALRDYND